MAHVKEILFFMKTFVNLFVLEDLHKEMENVLKLFVLQEKKLIQKTNVWSHVEKMKTLIMTVPVYLDILWLLESVFNAQKELSITKCKWLVTHYADKIHIIVVEDASVIQDTMWSITDVNHALREQDLMELKDHVSVFVMLMKSIMDKNVSVQLAIT